MKHHHPSNHANNHAWPSCVTPKFEGQISAKYVETKPNEFFMIGEWNSEDAIAKARPKMIEFLDSLRHTLEELSSELGVTDPHSGTVVIEK